MSQTRILWQSLLTAMSFLSIFPVPRGWLTEATETRVQGYSILFYPLIGLFIGLTLLLASFFLSVFGAMLGSALLVSLWALLTGALHLDGLADTADAWLGGHGDPDKTLRILKDTQIGVAAVVTIVLLLLLKILTLQEIQSSWLYALVLTPVISRTLVMVLLLTTPYIRENGIASSLTNSLPGTPAWFVVAAVTVFCALLLQWHLMFILISVCLFLFIYRMLMIRRIRGITGDTAGALIEISELIVLLNFAALEFLNV